MNGVLEQAALDSLRTLRQAAARLDQRVSPGHVDSVMRAARTAWTAVCDKLSMTGNPQLAEVDTLSQILTTVETRLAQTPSVAGARAAAAAATTYLRLLRLCRRAGVQAFSDELLRAYSA